MPEDAPPRFLADAMLGRLARWLRLAGLDCAYERDGVDGPAAAGPRILLTRDRELAAKAQGNALLIVSERHVEQIQQVIEHFHIDLDTALARCGDCNLPLATVAPREVYGRVPLHVFETHHEFQLCPSCSRVYWRGTQFHRIAETLRDGH